MHLEDILRTITRTVVVVITITTIILNKTIRASKILAMVNTNKTVMVRCNKIRFNRIMVVTYNKTVTSQ